jgi:hypothetical protein
MCGPRARDIDPLVLHQADWVYLFDLPHPYDRDAVAGTVGWKPAELAAALDELPPYGYLRWDVAAHELVEFPPLPAPHRSAAARAARAGRLGDENRRVDNALTS